MDIPTEPIGSIPRPLALLEAVSAFGDGEDPRLEALYEEALRDTIERFEATGSPVITDGEQRKYHNFWTYSVHGLENTSPDGFKIPFSAGHTRRMPRLTGGPFHYKRYADQYLDRALRYAHVPLKQAVISPSALSLMYPPEGIPDYPRETFLEDLLREHETEVRSCLRKGARVQIDFTESRLALKIDPSGHLLSSFIDLNNLALSRFSAAALPRVFNMFSQVHSTTDRSEGGLGIGLALARGLIDLHDGKLEASSAGLGCGSEFTVRLPRRPVMEAQLGESNTRASSAVIRCCRILIADDNRDSAETLAALLRMDGHEVMTVHDGPVALSAFGELKPEVALLDIGMPGLTGYEVARKMRQAAFGAPLTLIAITGWGQDVDKERAVAAGFDHHLTKPVDPRRLADLLRF
jgi:CheY-like chemotaxis protein